MNERIRTPQIRVIGAEGGQLGIMTVAEGLRLAREAGFDLVEVAGAANPPVCRIMDYMKYKYEEGKKERAAKRKQHVVHIKEMKFKPRIEEHDYEVKMRHIREFLGRGDKTKVTVVFRGREMAHTDIGRRLLERITQDLAAQAAVERTPLQEGRFLSMVFTGK